MKPSAMTVLVSAVETRRGQKSAATRRRILDATFEALFELGFSRTSTSEVCRRAGVARGTLLHHFPNTRELVTAAAEDIFLRRLAGYRAAFAKLPAKKARGGEALGMLWEIVRGPTYYAWLEIVVASRTDPELRARVQGVMQRFGDAVDASFREMFPVAGELPFDQKFVPQLAFAVLKGLAVDEIFADVQQTEDAVAVLRGLADMAEQMTRTKR